MTCAAWPYFILNFLKVLHCCITSYLSQSSILVHAKVEQQVAVLVCLEIRVAQKPLCHVGSPAAM